MAGRGDSRPTIERLLARICIDGIGCWNWYGHTDRAGYGVISLTQVPGQPQALEKTHRVAYQHYVGPVPAGLHIDHLCRNSACCNPDHLQPVTAQENARRRNQQRNASLRWERTSARRRPRLPVLDVPCPSCGASIGFRCYAAEGGRGPSHEVRYEQAAV